jgi:hypothetical protein
MSNFRRMMNRRFPQNYLLRHPLIGSIIVLIFCFLFIVVYKPLQMRETPLMSFMLTMACYTISFSASIYLLIIVLKRIKYFSDIDEWTFTRELFSVMLILIWMGITIYFMGFAIEPPGERWNISTFLDSCKYAFLLGILPLGFFTLSNFRHALADETTQEYQLLDTGSSQWSEELIHISSRLKKEELSFYPEQFIYAESDGNYVVFYLESGNGVRKEIIRNSITEIEKQLSNIPFITRTHRAFLVNIKKILSKKGNSLGYRLRLPGPDSLIPVSRQNIQHFDELMHKFR